MTSTVPFLRHLQFIQSVSGFYSVEISCNFPKSVTGDPTVGSNESCRVHASLLVSNRARALHMVEMLTNVCEQRLCVCDAWAYGIFRSRSS